MANLIDTFDASSVPSLALLKQRIAEQRHRRLDAQVPDPHRLIPEPRISREELQRLKAIRRAGWYWDFETLQYIHGPVFSATQRVNNRVACGMNEQQAAAEVDAQRGPTSAEVLQMFMRLKDDREKPSAPSRADTAPAADTSVEGFSSLRQVLVEEDWVDPMEEPS